MLSYIKLGGLIAAGVAVAALVVIVNGWRTDAARVPILKQAVAQAEAERDAQLEAARRSAEAAVAAQTKADALAKETRKVRIVYQEATREDPDCAAWSRAPILCPLAGVPKPATPTSGNLPGDSGQPDP